MSKKEEEISSSSRDGINYRDIADAMTLAGHVMNHSSARNHVIRAMHKFAEAINERFDLNLSESRLRELAGNSKFQTTISHMLSDIISTQEDSDDSYTH